MKGNVLGALMLLGGTVAPAMAQPSPAPAIVQDAPLAEEAADSAKKEAQATESAAKPGEKVCKVIKVTGSRFKSRQCHTQQVWEEIDRAHKAKMREIDSQPIFVESEGSGFPSPDLPPG